MIASQLAVDEPLSPELVLVLPAELRARVLADLGAPVRPTPVPRIHSASPSVAERLPRSVGRFVVVRCAQLALIFAVVTIATFAMSLVAQAVR